MFCRLFIFQQLNKIWQYDYIDATREALESRIKKMDGIDTDPTEFNSKL